MSDHEAELFLETFVQIKCEMTTHDPIPALDPELQNQVDEQIRLYETVVQNTPVGLIVCKPENPEDERSLRFVVANAAAAEMIGVPADNLLGKRVIDVFPDLFRTELPKRISIMARSKKMLNLGELHYGDERIRDGFYSTKIFAMPHDCVGIVFENITERVQTEENLRKSEMQLAMAQRIAQMGSWEWDLSLNTILWSKELYRIYGLKAKEFDGTYEAFLKNIHPEDREHADKIFQRALQDGRPFRFEHRLDHADGETRLLLVQGQVIPDKEGKPALVIGTACDITESKLSEQRLERSREQLRALSQHLQSIREEERARIAREVHDELGQVLTALKMDLSLFSYKILDSSANVPRRQLLDEVASMSRMVDTTIQMVRKIVTELRPEVLDHLGLKAAIEWQAQEFQTRTGIQCNVITNLENIEFENRDCATAVFRILQETLTNVARHANAARVDIQLEERDASLVLEVKDDGRGIAENDVSKPSSFGLLGIQERAIIFGGEVQIHGEPNQGTTLTVRIPLKNFRPADRG